MRKFYLSIEYSVRFDAQLTVADKRYTTLYINMTKIKECIESVFIISIGTLISIVVLPFSFLMAPLFYFRRKKFEKEYSSFLIEQNGTNFFCYNNRKKSKQFIEEIIIPSLSKDIEIIHLNGRKIESKYPIEFISNILHSLKTYNKFPHLVKVRNGKLVDKSINNLFYLILNQYKPQSRLQAEINHFFEIIEENRNSTI